MPAPQPVGIGHRNAVDAAQIYQRTVWFAARAQVTADDLFCQIHGCRLLETDGCMQRECGTALGQLPVPVRYEYIGLTGRLAIAVRGKYELLAIIGEHWEAVEAGILRDPLDFARIHINKK